MLTIDDIDIYRMCSNRVIARTLEAKKFADGYEHQRLNVVIGVRLQAVDG